MGHMVKYPDRRDGTTLFDFYGNPIPAGAAGLVFSAAGQLLVGTGVATGELFPVGTAGQVLTVGGVDPGLLEWATPAAGAVAMVSAGDATMAISPTTGNVVARTGTLDAIANLAHAVADWTNNGHKITALAAPSATGDAVSQGHVLAPLETEFASAGQLIVGTGSGTGELLNKGSAGSILTVGGADSSGLEWVAPAAFNIEKTWVIMGTVVDSATLAVPAFFAPVLAGGQSMTVVEAIYYMTSGSCTVAVNQAAFGASPSFSAISGLSALSVTTTPTHTSTGTPPSVASRDLFQIVITSAASTPLDLTLTLVFSVTV